jgi:hypothetical protein
MERDRELPKLINVLRRTARLATDAMWTESSNDSAEAAYCTQTYNRVLTQLKQRDAGLAVIFDALPPDSSLGVVIMACRELTAYYEDEVSPHPEPAGASEHLIEFGESKRRPKALAERSANTAEVPRQSGKGY